MSEEIIAVLTFKSKEHILHVGGTCSWTLNRAHARQLPYVVCVRNAHSRVAEGPELHGTAFIVGRIKEVVPSPEHPGRWLIAFSEYAEVSVANAWKGWRNPVRYTTFEELGISADGLDWHPMPAPSVPQMEVTEEAPEGEAFTLTIAQAKQGIANALGISPSAVEITIRA
ncbi:MAG: hypothetical protein E5W72_12990 [Mesorhizobium sp.]|nr:MAG: hypothetical protein E5W72_12990 [Mesorhizobium sp.]